MHGQFGALHDGKAGARGCILSSGRIILVTNDPCPCIDIAALRILTTHFRADREYATKDSGREFEKSMSSNSGIVLIESFVSSVEWPFLVNYVRKTL